MACSACQRVWLGCEQSFTTIFALVRHRVFESNMQGSYPATITPTAAHRVVWSKLAGLQKDLTGSLVQRLHLAKFKTVRADFPLVQASMKLMSPPMTVSLSPSLSLSLPLCRIGTAGIAVQVVGSNWPKPHYTLLITGLCRFRVSSLLTERPFILAEVKLV